LKHPENRLPANPRININENSILLDAGLSDDIPRYHPPNVTAEGSQRWQVHLLVKQRCLDIKMRLNLKRPEGAREMSVWHVGVDGTPIMRE